MSIRRPTILFCSTLRQKVWFFSSTSVCLSFGFIDTRCNGNFLSFLCWSDIILRYRCVYYFIFSVGAILLLASIWTLNYWVRFSLNSREHRCTRREVLRVPTTDLLCYSHLPQSMDTCGAGKGQVVALSHVTPW